MYYHYYVSSGAGAPSADVHLPRRRHEHGRDGRDDNTMHTNTHNDDDDDDDSNNHIHDNHNSSNKHINNHNTNTNTNNIKHTNTNATNDDNTNDYNKHAHNETPRDAGRVDLRDAGRVDLPFEAVHRALIFPGMVKFDLSLKGSEAKLLSRKTSPTKSLQGLTVLPPTPLSAFGIACMHHEYCKVPVLHSMGSILMNSKRDIQT